MSDLIIISLLVFMLLGGLYIYNKLDESEPVVVTKTEYVPYEVPVYWNIPTRYPRYGYPRYDIQDTYIQDMGIVVDTVTVIDMVILHEDGDIETERVHENIKKIST